MTFIEALKSGRPMRRLSTMYTAPWLYLGERDHFPKHPVWRRIDTGEQVGLNWYDYEAKDWEVMA